MHGIWMKPLYRDISQKGYDVHIITPKIFADSKSYERSEGVTIHRFSFFARGKMLYEYKRIPVLRMICYFLSGFCRTVQVVFSHKCGLIHIHFALPIGLIGILAGKLTGRKAVLTAYGTDIEWFEWSRSPIVRAIAKFVLSGAEMVTAISPFAAEAAKRCYPSLGQVEVTGVGGVNFNEIGKIPTQSSARSQLGVAPDNFLILFIGRLSRRKRVRDLMRAFAGVDKEIPAARLIIVGEGEDLAGLKQMSLDLKLQEAVSFPGHVPSVYPYYAAADLFVLPSELEGLGIVTMEAMACGCAVLASRAGASMDLIEDGQDGFLFTAGSADDLEQKILILARNRDLLKKSAALARMKAENYFQHHQQVQKFLKLYK